MVGRLTLGVMALLICCCCCWILAAHICGDGGAILNMVAGCIEMRFLCTMWLKFSFCRWLSRIWFTVGHITLFQFGTVLCVRFDLLLPDVCVNILALSLLIFFLVTFRLFCSHCTSVLSFLKLCYSSDNNLFFQLKRWFYAFWKVTIDF